MKCHLTYFILGLISFTSCNHKKNVITEKPTDYVYQKPDTINHRDSIEIIYYLAPSSDTIPIKIDTNFD